jgi:replicative DNA helicase
VATVEKPSREQSRNGVSDIIARTPPRSIEAEKAVLGSIFLLPEVCDEVALICRPEDFYDEIHRKIFRLMLSMHENGRPIEVPLVLEELKNAGVYEEVGGAAYLLELTQVVVTAAHAEHYAKIIRDKSMLRTLIHAGTDIVKEAYDTSMDAREMLARAEQRVFRILDTRQDSQVRSVRDVLHDALTRIDARAHGNTCLGTETGFIDFDNLTGGLHDSELIILAARPSMGKTALALNMVEHIAVDERGPKKPTLIVSLEMAALELADRLLCSAARIDSHKIRNNRLGAEDSRKLVETAATISRAPLFIDDSANRNMTEIAAAARRLKRRENLGLIVIDYLQLVEPDNSRDPRQEQVARIARRLKGLARELKIPVLCLAQLNRQADSLAGHKPQLSHLRESGAIEQDADVVMFIHREEMYSKDAEERQQVAGQAELLVKKQRNGPTNDLKLCWFGSYTRFENYQQPEFNEFNDFGPDRF